MKVYLVWRDLWWDWDSDEAECDTSIVKVFTTKELAIDYIKSVNEEELSRTIELRYERVVFYVDERELIGELP